MARSFVTLCLLTVAFASCAPEDFDGDDIVSVDEAGLTVSGQVSSNGKAWVTQTFDATAGDTITLTLDWRTASADLNLFLYAPSGELVQGSSGGGRPEVVSTQASATGKYKVGIKCKSGSTAYTLKIAVDTANPQPPPPVPGKKALLGMSAPGNLWDARVKEVGPGLQARRIFYGDFGAGLSLTQRACADGMYPIISFKTGGYSWAQVAAGAADADLRALASRLAGLHCKLFVAIHHEPAKDGAAADWAAMQEHALPLLKANTDISVGVIGNGWWWSATAQGYTDAEIAQYITPRVKAVSDVIASDTYQTSVDGEESAPKMIRMGEWARRTGGVKALGVGEFNGPTAIGITHATQALANDPLFAWGCLWNADGGVATVLVGDRLDAFRKALAAW